MSISRPNTPPHNTPEEITRIVSAPAAFTEEMEHDNANDSPVSPISAASSQASSEEDEHTMASTSFEEETKTQAQEEPAASAPIVANLEKAEITPPPTDVVLPPTPEAAPAATPAPTANAPKAALSPFQILDNSLSDVPFQGTSHYEPRLNQAIFFDNVLKTIEENRAQPETAVELIEKMVGHARDDHPEISDMLVSFYRQITCLYRLTAETILADYDDYIASIQANPPTSDWQTFLKMRLLQDQQNIFAKLHLYLQQNEKDSKNERKFNDFISVLCTKLPELSPQNADDEFAATPLTGKEAEYKNEINAITKKYTEKTLLLFNKYTGTLKKLMVALHEAKAPDAIREHRVYLDLLNQAPVKKSPFVGKIKEEMNYVQNKMNFPESVKARHNLS